MLYKPCRTYDKVLAKGFEWGDYAKALIICLDQIFIKNPQSKSESNLSENAFKNEMRPRPLKSDLETKTNLQYYNTTELYSNS